MMVIRLDGSPKFAMMCNIVPAVINFVLDYILVFPCGMGVKGAAIATLGEYCSGYLYGARVLYSLLLCHKVQVECGWLLFQYMAAGVYRFFGIYYRGGDVGYDAYGQLRVHEILWRGRCGGVQYTAIFSQSCL